MTAYSIKEARRLFSHLVKRVSSGESISILRHGKPVAVLASCRAKNKPFPSLREFRSTIKVKGLPGSKVVARLRNEDRN
jgi:prevent-host-death family protein